MQRFLAVHFIEISLDKQDVNATLLFMDFKANIKVKSFTGTVYLRIEHLSTYHYPKKLRASQYLRLCMNQAQDILICRSRDAMN